MYVKTKGKYSNICSVCSKEFISKLKATMTCSEDCRKERYRKQTGRIGNKEVTSGSVGAMSELRVCAYLLDKGYSVFRSVSPSCFCDVIAIKGNNHYQIEVRTGYKNPNTNNLHFSKQFCEGINCFAIFERTTQKIYYLDLNLKLIDL